MGDHGNHETLLRRPPCKDRQSGLRRYVQIRSGSLFRRQPLLRQALREDGQPGSVTRPEEGWWQAAQGRGDHSRKLLEEDVKERPAATVKERRRFLEHTTGDALSDSTVGRLLKRMGFSQKNGLLWGRWNGMSG